MNTLAINRFDGGMTNDPRDPSINVAKATIHFDNFTRKYKLTPYRRMVLDAVTESSLDTYQIRLFVLTNSGLYGVGIVGGGDVHTQIYVKTTATDPTAAWTTASSGTSASSIESYIGAVVYHNYIYGVNSVGVWKYGDITSSPSFTYNDYTTNIPTAPGLVHSKDDKMYWPSNNLILVNSSGSWSVGLTLPTNCSIVSICEDGNYLSIMTNQPNGLVIVYRWDRDATLQTLPEVIQWGAGTGKLLESIGGVLCGISTTPNTTGTFNPQVYFNYYTGSRVALFQKFTCSTYPIISTTKQKYNELFYFTADIAINGSSFAGVWKIYKDEVGRMAVSFDRLPRNDTSLHNHNLYDAIRWGDYVYVAYLNPDDSDKFTIWRTDSSANYTATSIYESTINPGMPDVVKGQAGHRTNQKQLVAVALAVEPLTSGQQAVMKYKIDGGSWTTIFTMSTVGQVVQEAVFDSSGLKFENGREYEFRIESTGGAEITEFKYKYEVLNTLL